MTKHIQINITDYFFNNADELENTLHLVGERVTNGQYKAGESQILVNNRVLGEIRITEKQLTFVQCLKAGHDTNGNRRAIYLQYNISGDIIAVYNKTIKDYIIGAKKSPLVSFFEGE